MDKVLRSLSLACALLMAPLGPIVYGQEPQSREVAQNDKVKKEILKRSTGGKSRVTVKLRDGSEMKGIISGTTDNMFSLKDEKTGRLTDFSYSDVTKVNGRGLSKAAKFGIIGGIVLAGVAVAAIISIRNFDPFENIVITAR